MPHAKKILAILISSLALSACMDDVDVKPDENIDTTPVDPGTGQVFPETGYTKIGNDGIILADQSQAWDDNGSEAAGTQWSCVRDNDTGLYWEVKTNDGGLRDTNFSYTWYDTNPTTNGGDWGVGDTGVGTTTGYENFALTYSGSDFCLDSARCDTEKYIEDVNATQLCGFDDWRLPTGDGSQDGVAAAQELQGLLNFNYFPRINTDYFPNTQDRYYWSSSPYASTNISAWDVNFNDGNDFVGNKNLRGRVRLVRASQSL